MKKKNNTWFKVVIIIIILELVIGGAIFAYKKLGPTKNADNISTKDKEVIKLYEKIAYNDIDTLDVMSPEIMLYYGYKNTDITESINCDVANIEDDTTGYSCNGIVDFVSSDTLEKEIKDIYGSNVIIEKRSFELDPNHYVFYDNITDGYVLYTKDEQEEVNPVNLNLKAANKDDDGNIILTVEVLDGIVGKNLNTYNYTFEKDGKNYYLVSKEIVTS